MSKIFYKYMIYERMHLKTFGKKNYNLIKVRQSIFLLRKNPSCDYTNYDMKITNEK